MNKSYLKNIHQDLPRRSKTQAGFIAFTSLLVISAITLSIAISISLLGVGEARNSLDAKRSTETLKIADSCVEEALQRLKINSSYAGGSLNVGDGQCTINVSGGAENKTLNITGTISEGAGYTKTIQIILRVRGGGIVMRQRQELP